MRRLASDDRLTIAGSGLQALEQLGPQRNLVVRRYRHVVFPENESCCSVLNGLQRQSEGLLHLESQCCERDAGGAIGSSLLPQGRQVQPHRRGPRDTPLATCDPLQVELESPSDRTDGDVGPTKGTNPTGCVVVALGEFPRPSGDRLACDRQLVGGG